jgi:hypothetical protein
VISNSCDIVSFLSYVFISRHSVLSLSLYLSFRFVTYSTPDVQQIHEAIRAGHHRTVEYLVENGADINHLTKDGTSPLRMALDNLGPSHIVTKYLEDLGAEDHGDVIDERESEGQDDEDDEEEHFDDVVDDVQYFGDSNTDDHPGDIVPSIVKFEEEIVPTIRRIGEKIAERTPEIVPTIVGNNDDEEL